LEEDLVLAVVDHIVGQVLSLGMLAYVLVHSYLVEHRKRPQASAVHLVPVFERDCPQKRYAPLHRHRAADSDQRDRTRTLIT
jgi:hypothetical protein